MIKARPENNKLGLSFQEHLQGQILAVLTADIPGGRPNLVHPQASIESLL